MFTDIEVIIGHHRRDRTPLPLESVTTVTNWMSQLLGTICGGVHISGCNSFGAYMAQDRQVMREPCTVFRAYTRTLSDSNEMFLRETAAIIAAALDQE